MLQPTIAPVKKNSTAIAAAKVMQPVMNNSNAYQAKKVANTYGNSPIQTSSPTWQHVVITEKSIRHWINPEGKINISGVIGWIDPELTRDYNCICKKCNVSKDVSQFFVSKEIGYKTICNVCLLANPAYVEDFTGCDSKEDSLHIQVDNNQPVMPRKARVIVNNADMTELAEISLGYFRNIYMKHPSYNVTLFGRRVETPSRDGKIIYTTVISAKNADVDMATKLIKEIAIGTKTEISWL